MVVVPLRDDISANDAVRIDSLCDRVLKDMGSIYMRAYSEGGFPPALVELRRFLRETQDLVRERVPTAFYK